MDRYRVTYYRTLICEEDIEAGTLSEVKQKAEGKISGMLDADFDQIREEAVEIEHNGVPLCVIIANCWI